MNARMPSRRELVGKTIVDFDARADDDGRGGTFTLDDGSRLYFTTEEQTLVSTAYPSSHKKRRLQMNNAATLRLREPTEDTVRYEVAAWYKTRTTEPGDYPCRLVEAFDATGSRKVGFSFVAEVPATVTDACFVSLFGGVPYGADPSGRHAIGQRETVTISKPAVTVFNYGGSGYLTGSDIRNVRSAALKIVMADFTARVDENLAAASAYWLGDRDPCGRFADARPSMAAHCADVAQRYARALANAHEYRRRRIAHKRGVHARKMGLDREFAVDLHYDRGDHIGHTEFWNGWNEEHKRRYAAGERLFDGVWRMPKEDKRCR